MIIDQISMTGEKHPRSKLKMILEDKISTSRFIADVEYTKGKYRGLKIVNVRLKKSKPYCGNHPGECEFMGDLSKKRTFLGGADWVEFNDLLNDTLDFYKISANIRSVVCIVRKGSLRRTHYWMFRPKLGRTLQWNYDEGDRYYTENLDGESIVSVFPDGTPGIYQKIGYEQI